MHNETSTKKFILSGGIFLLLIALSLYVLSKGVDIQTLKSAFAAVKLPFVFLGAVCGLLFVFGEGINICRTLRLIGLSCTWFQGIRYGFLGFFFSAITPFASGGQPMQLYFMNKEKIQISHGSLALLLELASYQVVSVSLAVLLFFCNFTFFQNVNSKLTLFLCLGVLLNLAVLLFILLALFSKTLLNRILALLFRVLRKLRIRKADRWEASCVEQLKKYHEGAAYIRKNPFFMVKTIIITLLQFLALHSIPFCIYLAFDLSGVSYFTIFSIQAVLYIAVSAIPLPGAVGITEGVFLALFGVIYTKRLLPAALLLSRWDSFYFVLLVSAVVLAVSLIKQRCQKTLPNKKIF